MSAGIDCGACVCNPDNPGCVTRNWCAACALEVVGDPDRSCHGKVVCSEYCRGRQDERDGVRP